MKRNQILNEETNYSDMVSDTPKKEIIDPKAYCSSIQCMTGPQWQNYNKLGVLKKVSRQNVFCKDCGSALFWVKDKYNGRWVH